MSHKNSEKALTSLTDSQIQDVLRACAETALERLRQPEADVVTIAGQMSYTAAMVLADVRNSECDPVDLDLSH